MGLNFFPPSPRYVNLPQAVELAEIARGEDVLPVGLFVNEPVERVLSIADELQLGWVQLHGDEPPSDVTYLRERGVSVIRAVRLRRGSLAVEEITEKVQPWRGLGCEILLDADVGGAYGGQGAQLDWNAIQDWGQPPYILAGGLTVANVRDAVLKSGATSVDVSSGVEVVRGEKSSRLVEAFCHAAREALATE